MSKIENVLYTGKTHTTGGREGRAVSSDGRLDVKLSHFVGKGEGTNPEQLLAAGWSACYMGAIGIAAQELGVTLPSDFSVDAEVDLGKGAGGYALQARLNVNLPGLAADVARQLADKAHTTCPYSKALHGNIDVETRIAA